MDNYTLKHYLESIAERMCASFGETFRCLILYGSWAKGTAREDSDIDLLAVFEKVDSKINSLVNKVQRNTFNVKNVSIVPALVNEFYKETIPLYTSVKREGKIIWGNADLTLSNEKPTIKYAGAFSKSRVFEMNKIKIAGDIIKKYPSYGSADLCYMASKHAIQMALAMKGVGYSSKFSYCYL